MIDVQHQHRQRLAKTLATLHLFLQAAVEPAAVVQAGKRVGDRPLFGARCAAAGRSRHRTGSQEVNTSSASPPGRNFIWLMYLSDRPFAKLSPNCPLFW